MRFDCGLDKREKAKLYVQFLGAEAQRLRNPHPWFAWFPVRVGPRDCRWLEYVNRSYPDAEVVEWCRGHELITYAPVYKAMEK